MSMCITFDTLYRTGVELSMKCQISCPQDSWDFSFFTLVRIESIVEEPIQGAQSYEGNILIT